MRKSNWDNLGVPSDEWLHGRIEGHEFIHATDRLVESWLRDTPSRKVVSSPFNNGGKWASTDWWLLDSNDDFSLIELHLNTGRKNQIRVHMEVLGHPVVGDYKYGSIEDSLGDWGSMLFDSLSCIPSHTRNSSLRLLSLLASSTSFQSSSSDYFHVTKITVMSQHDNCC